FAIDTKVTYLSNGRETKSNNGDLFNLSWCIFVSEDPKDLLIEHYREKFAREKIDYQEKDNKWSVTKGIYPTPEYIVTLQILSVRDRGYHSSLSLPANTKSVITAVLEKKQQKSRSNVSSYKIKIAPNLKLLQEPINPPIPRSYIFAIDTQVTYADRGQEFKYINKERFNVTWCVYISQDPKDLLVEHYRQKFSR
uniref:hypothetical protein n=1 Tax=Anaplasma marginale TaxID=770 RepID=UPI0005B540A5